MQRMTIVAMAAMLVAAPAFGQGAATAAGDAVRRPARRHAAPAKPAAAASTPESRSAAALALPHDPTYDEGSAQRIREAALSYSDIAVRGGWPAIPSDAKFASGTQGAHDELLRKRLIISGDLAADKASGAYDDTLAEAVKRFQVRHGLAATGTVTPRTLAALNVSVQKRIKQLEASLERLGQHEFSVRPALCGREYPRDLRRSDRGRQGGAALSRHRRQDRKAVADADRRHHQRQPQPDLDRAVVDREERDLRAYAQGPELSLAHAYGSARRQ